MIRLAALALFVLAACGPSPASKTADPATVPEEGITLTACDGVKVFATEYRADQPKATVLLFHQAGSGKGEYATIAPRLAAAGYDALAVDQRSGGTLYGENATVKALGHSADYLAAQADLQAAIDWARAQKRPIVLWGSSYSSALVFLLAAKNPDVTALLAFSPGEYFDDKTLVQTAARKLAIPVYVTVAGRGTEEAAARPIVAAVPGARATFYIPRAGVHGSSTLIAAKNPHGAASNWQPVWAFLRTVAP